MDTGIKGKIALVGGGSRGLGKACALQLAKEGVKVAVCARTEEELLKTSEFIRKETGVKVLPVQGDLSKSEAVNRVVQETQEGLGNIDILVVNSGGPPPGDFFKFNSDDWKKAYESVLRYVIELYGLIIPGMKKRRWGRIINITSLAVKEPSENLILSTVFRTGVIALAKSLSRSLAKDNVTVNSICPGAFKTARAIDLMNSKAKKTGMTFETVEQAAVEGMPLRRYQSPEELGNVVAFLSSELAKGITGTVIQIDGGISKGLL